MIGALIPRDSIIKVPAGSYLIGLGEEGIEPDPEGVDEGAGGGGLLGESVSGTIIGAIVTGAGFTKTNLRFCQKKFQFVPINITSAASKPTPSNFKLSFVYSFIFNIKLF